MPLVSLVVTYITLRRSLRRGVAAARSFVSDCCRVLKGGAPAAAKKKSARVCDGGKRLNAPLARRPAKCKQGAVVQRLSTHQRKLHELEVELDALKRAIPRSILHACPVAPLKEIEHLPSPRRFTTEANDSPPPTVVRAVLSVESEEWQAEPNNADCSTFTYSNFLLGQMPHVPVPMYSKEHCAPAAVTKRSSPVQHSAPTTASSATLSGDEVAVALLHRFAG